MRYTDGDQQQSLRDCPEFADLAYRRSLGLDEIADVLRKGVKIEVGDLLPSSEDAKRLKHAPKAWEKAFEVNAGSSEAVRALCLEFILAGLYATESISRYAKHGRIVDEV